MADLIVRALHAICIWLSPAKGAHRTPAPTEAPAAEAPTSALPRPRRLPLHQSPYAIEVAARRTFVDALSLSRPYVTTPSRKPPATPKQQAQAERRWALDMAARGIDVGPSVIHGVHIGSGSRTIHVKVAA
ncbi:hypothetical protein OK074_3304 [Actinobacteria bacterium OK074]|nr:hypothetical protein OK074_3304 [Actinobacteria bacterium OK074]